MKGYVMEMRKGKKMEAVSTAGRKAIKHFGELEMNRKMPPA